MRPCRPYSADTRPQTGLSRQNVPRPNLLSRSAMLARRAAAQEHILRSLVVTGALAIDILAPRGHRMTGTRGHRKSVGKGKSGPVSVGHVGRTTIKEAQDSTISLHHNNLE